MNNGQSMKVSGVIPLLGRFYKCCILPLLPVKLFSIRKKIGKAGFFFVHPRFLFRNFSKWGEKINPEFNVIIDECKKKKVIFDIGAHIGLFTLPISRNISDYGTVYAFEPATKEFSYLLHHLEINKIKNVKPINAVVGLQSNSEVDFYEYNDETGLSSMLDYYGNARKTCKKQISVDSFCEENNVIPDLIKIDVEGAELDVIQGASKIIMKHNPQLFVSIHPLRLGTMGKNKDDFFGLLDKIGYALYTLEGNQTSVFESGEFILKPMLHK